MSPPKAIIFDLGKVLLDFDYQIALRRLLPRCGLTFEALRRVLTQDPLLLEYEGGQHSTAEFFTRLQALTGYTGTLAEFRRVFGDIFTPIEPMLALHADLRARGWRTYIFSNTNELAVEFIRSQFPFFAEFDGYVLSYEVRSMKPAPPMYEVVEQLSGCRGAELFYLDDRPENVAAGWSRGWQGVVHREPDESRAALARVGAV